MGIYMRYMYLSFIFLSEGHMWIVLQITWKQFLNCMLFKFWQAQNFFLSLFTNKYKSIPKYISDSTWNFLFIVIDFSSSS